MLKFFIIFFFLLTLSRSAEIIKMDLWPDKIPYDNELTGEETGDKCRENVSIPTITVFLPDEQKATGAAVVIMPGGAYRYVCVKTEGYNIAKILNAKGIAAIVLKYRLPNGHYRIPAIDARRAIRTTRFNATKWHIDPNKIGVWGFSAGGHLAATVTTVFDNGNPTAKDAIERLSSRPDFSILFYPVISMKRDITHFGSRNNLFGKDTTEILIEQYSNENRVSDKTPPVFLIHCSDDGSVNPENSIRFYQSLLAHGISAELLLFEKGGHGPGAFQNNPGWKGILFEWLKRRDCL